MAKKKKATAARMTITLPPELKKRMDRVKEPVNWSALAADAFTKKLGELAAKKEKKDMTDVIERLRASKMESASQQEKEGQEVGRAWATHSAEAIDLERLYRLGSSLNDYDWGQLCHNGHAGSTVAGAITQSDDYRDHEEFWEQILERTETAEDSDFITGFFNGALEVWRDVKDKI